MVVTCIIQHTEYVVINFNYLIEIITKLNIMVISTICNICVANNLSIIVFCFILTLLLIQLCKSWCTYIMYNIKTI